MPQQKSSRPIYITIDVEQDAPPFLATYRGIEEGLPPLLTLFSEKGVRATFFVTGDVARRYPQVMTDLISRGHEIGCHGDIHRRFDRISPAEAAVELASASDSLRRYYPVVSFRAPNLQFPTELLGILTKNGYMLDSTEARHKHLCLNVRSEGGILRVPVSTTSLVLRLPKILRDIFLRRFADPVVLFVHPWEFVDLTKEKLRFDCRWRTGEYSLKALAETIDFFKEKGGNFLPLRSILENVSPDRS